MALHAGGRSFLSVPQELPRVRVVDVLVDDLDGDGTLDLLLVALGSNVVLSGDGMGLFRETTAELGLADAGQGKSAERVDLDQDGRLDLLLHNCTHDVVFWARAEGGYERDREALHGNVLTQLALIVAAPQLPAAGEKSDALPTEIESGDPARARVTGDRGSTGIRRAIGTGVLPTGGLQLESFATNLVQGMGSAGRIPKWIGSANLGNSELFESAGDVGIGTLSPAGKLDVAGSVAVSGSVVINAAGQWVGDPTGLVGPAGPTGPPGVVSFGTLNTRGGTDALLNNTSGVASTAFGVNALRNNMSGTANTAHGAAALYSNTNGYNNTASGYAALRYNSSGNSNTAFGRSALASNTVGYLNTANGNAALAQNTSGARNIGIGAFAGSNHTTGSYNISIGNNGVGGESNTIRIGSMYGQNRSFLAGVRGVTTGIANGLPVLVDSAGQLGTVSSSMRFKADIRDMGAATERLLELRPVLFRYKQEQSMPAGQELVPEYGLIAEEVAEIFPDLVVYDDEGKPFTVKYHILSSMLLNELKKEHVANLARDVELAELKAHAAEQAARLRVLEQRE